MNSKQKFITSSNRESVEINIQLELLDETWAKWIQDFETRWQESNHVDRSERNFVETLKIVLLGQNGLNLITYIIS